MDVVADVEDSTRGTVTVDAVVDAVDSARGTVIIVDVVFKAISSTRGTEITLDVVDGVVGSVLETLLVVEVDAEAIDSARGTVIIANGARVVSASMADIRNIGTSVIGRASGAENKIASGRLVHIMITAPETSRIASNTNKKHRTYFDCLNILFYTALFQISYL